MWTVGGKSLLSIVFLYLLNLAFAQQHVQFLENAQSATCVKTFLDYFDDLSNSQLASPLFRGRVWGANHTIRDPLCLEKLENEQVAARHLRFIRRDLREATCSYRAQKTSLNKIQKKAICDTASSHDIVNLEAKNHNIIILGETHVKDILAAEKANRVLEVFPVRGIEGFSGDIELGTNTGIVYALTVLLKKAGVMVDSTTYKSSEKGYFFGFDGKSDFLMVNRARLNSDDAEITDPFLHLAKIKFQDILTNMNEYPLTIALERSEVLKNKIEKECKTIANCPVKKRNHLLINMRNADMANTTEKILANLPLDQDLLIIVGSRHVTDLADKVSCLQSVKRTVLSDLHELIPIYFDPAKCSKEEKI
jgi:hypothetical protein